MSDNFNANTETNAGTAVPVTKKVKPEFVPTTKGQASMIVDRLRKGITTLFTEIDTREAKIAALLTLAESLPDQAPASPAKAKIKLDPGTVVEFRYGRAETAKVKTGTIRARKDNAETGNPELYRVESGEGFDAELFTVYPGQIVVKAQPILGAESEATQFEV